MINFASDGPTIASLFCGCGGFDVGFESAGFRGVAAFDISPHAVSVFRRNVHGKCDVADLATASISKGSGTNITLIKELNFPHSLGLLY